MWQHRVQFQFNLKNLPPHNHCIPTYQSRIRIILQCRVCTPKLPSLTKTHTTDVPQDGCTFDKQTTWLPKEDRATMMGSARRTKWQKNDMCGICSPTLNCIAIASRGLQAFQQRQRQCASLLTDLCFDAHPPVHTSELHTCMSLTILREYRTLTLIHNDSCNLVTALGRRC